MIDSSVLPQYGGSPTSYLDYVVIGIGVGTRGDEVHIWVRDTGVGIPPQDLPRVTERFYRVDEARSRESGGTGLGLAIVKHIVERHKGTLDIRSTVGEGTAVTVSLPVAP